jgi:hypothetical protein
MNTSHTPGTDFVKIFRENIERSNKAKCQLCNNWTREKGCDHYGPDVHYKDFDSMVARIDNLEAGVLTHARINSNLMKQNAELLEALQEARRVITVLDESYPLDKIDSAISKATGN